VHAIATWVVLLLWAGITLWLAFRGSAKNKDLSDYALGSVLFSPAAVGLSLAASMTSAATFIINPGLIGLYGISGVISYAVVLPLAAFVALVVLTKSFRKYGTQTKALTLAQWMHTRYNHQGLYRLFAWLSLLLIVFLVLILVGLSQVLAAALHLPASGVLVGIGIFVFGYMMFGGANSMVYTNTIQALLMVVVAIALLGSGYEHFSQGVKGFLDKLAQIDPALIGATNPQSPLFRDYYEIIGAQLVIGFAIVCQPHIITKSLLLKNDQDVNRYLQVGILVQMLFFAVVIVGLYARLEFPEMTFQGNIIRPDALVSTYVIAEFPVYAAVVVVMGLIAAGISTLEGLIQSLSTTITADLWVPLTKNRTAPNKLLLVNKWAIVLLGLISMVIAYRQLVAPNLSVAILAQNGVYAYFAAACVPVFFGLFFKRISGSWMLLCASLAVLTHFGVYYLEWTPYMQATVKNPAIPAALGILVSLTTGFWGILTGWGLQAQGPELRPDGAE
jgi:sodium/pantothenate symporter